MSPRPKREEQTPDLKGAIIETAWQHIAEQGAPALSLRAIARKLGITAPAIYNYYPSRDDLVTALIIDAFTSFGDSQIEARDAIPVDDLPGRFRAIGMAYRQWATTYPQRYQLIFGTPLPGYEAPMEKVVASAARSLSALISVIEDIRGAGKLLADSLPEVMPEYEDQFLHQENCGNEVDPLSLSVAILIWCRVHGIVSLELNGHIPSFGLDGNAFYDYEIESVYREFIKG